MDKVPEVMKEYDKDGNYIGPILMPPKVREGRPDLLFERDMEKKKPKRGNW